ncbi:MAG: Glycosyltransferase [Candidatus Ozemobacter sibiricus]|jgi:glycosyltransferase involved in cell wall biosynthesis|uniref:Glycosyltransferase n=1 Tax=Candidatus Ozemobacter sibiricus TaxID=2268124 RepID=A0A367ZIP9_9BACT|nr:MAG: Glycosyltransferase [Candidatus Ozemobacter sibiricus]
MPSPGTRKRLLIVSQFYYPDITAAAFRIKETADLLAARGHAVHVIAGEPHKARAEGEGPLDDGRITVTRVPLVKADGAGTWNYIRHYLSFMTGAILASWRHPPRFDVVWASSPPLFTAVAGLIIARLKKARFVLDIRDLWPESAVVAGQLGEQGLLFRGAKQVERLLYRAADRLTCVAQPMADQIAATGGVPRPTVIYNGIPARYLADRPDRAAPPPEPAPAEGAAPAPASRDLEILYVGNLGHVQSIEIVLEAARLLQAEGLTDIRFTLIGAGVRLPALREQAAALGLTRVAFPGVLPKPDALARMRQGSALVLLLKDDGTMDKTIPSKVFDYMAAGRPILYGLRGEAREILGRVPGNLEFSPSSAASLADAIKKLRAEFPARATQASQNREIVQAEFLRERMVDRLEALFATL